jgi:hypothetical protein
MDLFLAGCQGVGLALAAGAFAGASGLRGTIANALMIFAMVGGAALFGLSLDAEDHPAWPGWPVGAALAAFAFAVVRDIAESVARRAEGGAFTSALIAFAALVLAALAVLLPPVSLLALAFLLWLFVGRRNRSARKYEGLRTLR